MTARRLPHRHLLESVRLERWHRRAIYAATALLLVSGGAWLIVHLFAASDGMPDAREPLLMKVHGAAAMVALALYGSLINAHARRAWRLGRNRRSGGAVASAAVVLIATAWLLYYAGNESLREVGSVVHWVVGLAIASILPIHVWLGRRSR